MAADDLKVDHAEAEVALAAVAGRLDPASSAASDVLTLIAPYPTELMEAFPISSAVPSVANDGPHLLERVNSA